MHEFTQYMPTEIVFGKGVQEKTAQMVKKWGGSKIILVYGKGSVERSGLLNTIRKELEEEAISYTEISGVKPNPRLGLAREGVERAVECGADMVLAIGGGSVIDTAKAIAIGAANPNIDIWDFWEGKKTVAACLPVGVVLTISAAGSEMSDSSVLTNEETGKKCGVGTDFVRPKFAIMNPELTYTLPKYQIACGIVDIFMHTIERYFTPVKGNRITDEIAEALMRTVIDYGTIAYEHPDSYEAMSEVMWCGSLSHNGLTGLGRPKDFAVHKLGHEISGQFDEAHGAALSALWGSWARHVYKADIPRFSHYARYVWALEIEDEEEAALAAIEETERFFDSLNMPIAIGQLSIGVQEHVVLRKMADSATKDDTIKLGCFRQLTAQDAYEIYKAANHA